MPPADATMRKNIPVTTPARTRRDLGWDKAPTRSGLERAFMGLLRKHRIPLPETDVRCGPYKLDFLWREERLVVDDRARDRYLHGRGLHVARYSDDELARDPVAGAASVYALLRERRSATGVG